MTTGGAVDASGDWRARAAARIPGSASTGSKRPDVLYGSAGGPTHFVRAHGCEVETSDGRTLIDCSMALGAVAIGYADPLVTRAVVAAAEAGPVSGLSPVAEVALAERLIALLPWAEQVRFLKTGAEAGAAAVRLARVVTGRTQVISCGYFGWLDWSSAEAGVPSAVQQLVHPVPFDDLAALDAAVDRCTAHPDGLAAIIVEPVIERLASPAWFAALRAHCDRTGALLILDEVKTGFRLHVGGAHARLGVRPDLVVFGKAMANGYPLSAVVGPRAIMSAATRTWISSTLASEGVALAAAHAVLDHHAAHDVCATLAAIGTQLRDGVQAALQAAGIRDLQVVGEPQMWGLAAADPVRRDQLVAATLARGVLLKRGFYQFAALAHTPTHVATILEAVADAAQTIGATS